MELVAIASLRELKTAWQIRFYDANRHPKRTTNSISKGGHTRAEAEDAYFKNVRRPA